MDFDTALKEETHKDDGLETALRVFYTLTDPTTEQLRLHRTTRLLSLLIGHLVEQQRLSEPELDTLLLNTIG